MNRIADKIPNIISSLAKAPFVGGIALTIALASACGGEPFFLDNDDGGAGKGGSGGDEKIPSAAYCDPTGEWTDEWRDFEAEILAITNQRRSEGANCATQGNFGPAGPLVINAELTCAARMHSKDMADREYEAHKNPDGDEPWDRAGFAEYGNYTLMGENIAWGYTSPASAMKGWIESDGHCSNIMEPGFTEIGIGYFPGGPFGHYWTQVFANPAD